MTTGRRYDHVRVLARGSACDLLRRVVRVRAGVRDLDRDLDRAVIPGGVRSAARAIARDVAGLRRRVYAGDCDRIRRQDRFRDVVSVHEYAALGDGLLGPAQRLARTLARYFVVFGDREPFYARVRDSDLAAARETARNGVRELAQYLDVTEVDVSAADLSGLGACDLDLLTNVIWSGRTTWPPDLAERVRACSREIRPGVYQVIG